MSGRGGPAEVGQARKLRRIDGVEAWREVRRALGDRSLGFVPTLGALHEGHASLLRRSVADNDLTVASIFVNPTQFDDADDLAGYPRTLAEDHALAEEIGVDYLFCPRREEIYRDGYAYRVAEDSLSRELCGRHRPGHFDGVLTVVLKLLNLVRPRRVYFGEKDYQQLELVRGMIDALFLDVELVACPTVRERDGLALSSRNRLLTPEERERAGALPRLLATPGPPGEVARRLAQAGLGVDYLEERRGRRFAAVRLGAVRLIDNLAWPPKVSGRAEGSP